MFILNIFEPLWFVKVQVIILQVPPFALVQAGILRNRLENDFSERILSFNLVTSQFYTELITRARLSGKAIGKADWYIAALANRLAVATVIWK